MRTRSRRRPRAARRCGCCPGSTWSSPCRPLPTRSRCATASPTRRTGGGLTAPLAVKAGQQTRTLTMTSQYAYLYNQYPFSNDPNAGLLHPDWWTDRVRVRAAAPTLEPSREAVPADEVLRRGATAARQDLQGGRDDPAHRARPASRGRSSTSSTPSSSACRTSRAIAVERAAVRRRSDRHAATPRRRSRRPSPRRRS